MNIVDFKTIANELTTDLSKSLKVTLSVCLAFLFALLNFNLHKVNTTPQGVGYLGEHIKADGVKAGLHTTDVARGYARPLTQLLRADVTRLAQLPNTLAYALALLVLVNDKGEVGHHLIVTQIKRGVDLLESSFQRQMTGENVKVKLCSKQLAEMVAAGEIPGGWERCQVGSSLRNKNMRLDFIPQKLYRTLCDSMYYCPHNDFILFLNLWAKIQNVFYFITFLIK